MKIGFFDSGIGGLTVLSRAIKELPKEDYIYYLDTKNVPYGDKSRDEVQKIVMEACEFIIVQGVKALVVACNTATSVAVRELRSKYTIPIVGMEPAIKPAIESHIGKRILVLATKLTLSQEKFHHLLKKFDDQNLVDYQELSGLVDFAESFNFHGSDVEKYLAVKLSTYDADMYETIVMGCTHFPYFKDMIKRFFNPNVNFIDGSRGTIRYLDTLLKEQNSISEGTGNIEFYKSGDRVSDIGTLKTYQKILEKEYL